MVSGHREIKIDWRPFSLAIKNKEAADNDKDQTKHGDMHRGAHRVLRVMLAAQDKGASLIDLYTDFGIQYHVAGNEYDDELILKVLAKHKLPEALLKAADDSSYDKALRASIKSATDVAGQDIGVPTIVFKLAGGDKNGYFGPVLQMLPDLEESLKLWDGLSMLATNKSFYELKRSRPSGGPDVVSTARC